MRLLSALPNLDDSGFILDELAYSLPAQPPSFREFSDSVVLLGEAAGVEGAGVVDNRPEMKHTLYWLAVECCTHDCLSSERRSSNGERRCSGELGNLESNSVFCQIDADLPDDFDVSRFD
jgi:hypothetical protein